MSKLKICVYAICKNESKFIDRWVESLKGEADCVVVLDTGSTDDSVEKLKAYEPFVTVKQYDYFKELGYFRFDKARNDSLKLVPFDTDICVVLDLDQVPVKGWGDIIRDKFSKGYNEVRGYIVDHDPYTGKELNRWHSRNVHPNSSNWFWTKIIHEGIEYYSNKNSDSINPIFCEDFVINHYPDESKDRSLYKTLLEYAVKEYPQDPYYGIYLGIELSRRYSKKEAANAFRRCLDECNFENNNDILYQTYINLALVTDDKQEALSCLIDAKSLGFETRRYYKTLADVYESLEKYDDAIRALTDAVEKVQSYSGDWKDNKEYFGSYIENRLSLFYYYRKNNYPKALEWCARALEKEPNDPIAHKNLDFYYKACKELYKDMEK